MGLDIVVCGIKPFEFVFMCFGNLRNSNFRGTSVQEEKSISLFLVEDDLPVKGTRETPTRGYTHQAGNSQSLSYKHCFKRHLTLLVITQNYS